ncbi:MAG TPA: hypothetical protein EYM31_04085 [Acidobacteria bacterium]|nr:hypothetical protein [Acidobacteriota bacterium]
MSDPRQDGYMWMLDNYVRSFGGRSPTMLSFRATLSVQTVSDTILAPRVEADGDRSAVQSP